MNLTGTWLWLEVAAVATVVLAAVTLILVVRGNRQIDRAFATMREREEAARDASNVKMLDDWVQHVADGRGAWW